MHVLTIRVPSSQGPGWSAVQRQAIMDGLVQAVEIPSDYMVAPGQTLTVHISVEHAPEPEKPGLLDARGVADLEQDWESEHAYPLPTTRSLSEIMREAVRHLDEAPTHGTDCVCMDTLVREIRAQATSSVPAWVAEMDNDRHLWEDRFDALARVRYLLHAAGRNL